ncbi:glycosyltransferase family 2 protein [Psychrobacter sp. 1U1]|uniref:glycosyltransferase family 2 protein n=2 Tax=unclassified Psychrobacter TaxID=196806 RepID=UPI003F44D9F9
MKKIAANRHTGIRDVEENATGLDLTKNNISKIDRSTGYKLDSFETDSFETPINKQAREEHSNVFRDNNYKETVLNKKNNRIYKGALNNNKQSSTDALVRLSFQLMTRAEPANMVIDTIKSLLAIKADDDEILIVDNNNTQTSLYEPLAQFCASLDAHHNVHFYHIDAVAGFKAGALNLALGLMDPECSHVVVVDSDYQALPQARVSIAKAIERYPDHALLQFPQFYRDAGKEDVHSELNHYFNHHLYRSFNRQRALSTGTYAVIRRRALLAMGGWSGASITEDAQMGVLMHGRGLRTRFIPEVIATGLLPTTLHDLMSQRRRWIYGNMQVLNTYFSTVSNSSTPSSSTSKKLSERLAYMGAHVSQLSAWVNFTGIFIVLQLLTLLIITGVLLFSTSLNIHALLMPLYAVYASYAVFLGRRLWAYMQDNAPLNQQTDDGVAPSLGSRLRAWALHLNFWELGALSWWPVLWGQKKPFICTPKQALVRTRTSVYAANLMAMPKALLMLNITTAIIVSPFSLLYSPLLFSCALVICILKIWSAKVMLVNYGYEKRSATNKAVTVKNTFAKNLSHSRIVRLNEKKSFEDDNTVNF